MDNEQLSNRIYADIFTSEAEALREERIKAITGPQGPRGERGLDGPVGPKGDRGQPGPQGPQGEKGDRGEKGLIGPQGLKGDRGEPGLKGDRGITGAPGQDGKHGRDGRDAAVPEFIIGSVVSGNTAKAELRRDENGVYVLNLVLPRGEQGPKGDMGPIGFRGHDGKDGLDSMVPGPQGEKGEIGLTGVAGPIGPQGEKGELGMTHEEIVKTIVDTLQDVGVMTEQAKKLVKLRLEIRKMLHETDERHMSQVKKLVKRVDDLF